MRIAPRTETALQAPRGSMDGMRLPASEVFLHHSVTDVTADPYADWRQVQAIAFGRAFYDISYSYGVHPGLPEVVMAGRGLLVGAHTLNHNQTAFGIVVVGNFEIAAVPDHVIDSVRWLQWYLKNQGHLNPGAVLEDHRSVYATVCPGRHLLERIDQMRVPWIPDGPRPPMPEPTPPPPPPPGPPPPPAVVVPPFPGREMALHAHGEDVRAVQQRLRDRGWTIGVDGDFGPETDRVVRAFQTEKRLTLDGIVGPATWRALWVDPIT